VTTVKAKPTSVPNHGILIHAVVWPQQTWAEKLGTAVPPFGGGGTGSTSNTINVA